MSDFGDPWASHDNTTSSPRRSRRPRDREEPRAAETPLERYNRTRRARGLRPLDEQQWYDRGQFIHAYETAPDQATRDYAADQLRLQDAEPIPAGTFREDIRRGVPEEIRRQIAALAARGSTCRAPSREVKS